MYRDGYKEKKTPQFKRRHDNARPYVRKKYTAQDYRQEHVQSLSY